jgi:alkylation response protein AidB-like acyl-CoA dehydrogenase
MSSLSPEIEELKQITRDFANKEVVPIAQQLDSNEAEISPELIGKMSEMGFFSVLAPKDFGGLEYGAMGVAVVSEELCRASLSVGSLPARNWLCGHILAKAGTEAQKRKWLSKMVAGELQTASAGTEPEAGSDAGNIKTKAIKRDGHYVVSGSKMWCTFANRANILFTYCRTSTESKHGGISLILVEKEPGDKFVPPQLTANRIRTVGYHGMNTYQLFFDGLEVPQENLLGGVEGFGFKQLMAGYEMVRVQFAFRCIGLAQAAYEAALEYSKQRVQFGQAISKFQAMRQKLADMATQIEAARQLGYMAATKVDRGERADLEAGMAKLFASEMAQHVCRDAVQIYGGNGFALDIPVNRFWRDSALLTIGEGTSEIQREVIARRILGER